MCETGSERTSRRRESRSASGQAGAESGGQGSKWTALPPELGAGRGRRGQSLTVWT